MARYGKIDINKVEVGMRVRVTQEYYRDGKNTKVVFEGEIEDVGWKTGRRGLIGGTPLPDAISTITLWGWTVCVDIGPGWTTTLVEQALPPLPKTLGSVIETENHFAAVLQPVYDPDGEQLRGQNIWIWADGTPGGPSERELNSARIIYEARRV